MRRRRRREVARIQKKPRFAHENALWFTKLIFFSWTKRELLPRQLSEPKKRQSASWQKLPRRLKRRRLRLPLPLRKQMRRVILMMTGKKQQPIPRMTLKIAGMLTRKRKERNLLPKRLLSQMAKQNRQAFPHGPRKAKSLSLSQTRMNHRKMKRYLRP